MKKMTPRERVYAAANFREPDQVPICFSGTTATGITECPPDGLTTSRLYKYLGLSNTEPVQIAPVFNGVINLDERVVESLGTDMRSVGPNPPPAIVHPDGTKTWDWFCGMTIKKIGLYDEPYGHPMKHMTTKEDIDEYPWPDPTENIMDGVVEKARYLHEETDSFVVGETLLEMFPLNGYGLLSGLDKWMTDIKIRPKFYHQLAERFLEYVFAVADQYFGQIGQYLDAAVIFDDLGTQQGPMISLADYLQAFMLVIPKLKGPGRLIVFCYKIVM